MTEMNEWIKKTHYFIIPVTEERKKKRKKEGKKHMDNEYRGKTYVIHSLKSKDILQTLFLFYFF